MGLGTEHRADLVDPLEHPHHHLLVELRALGQEGAAAEPVDREHVGSALRGGGHDLRREDLREAELVEGRPEPGRRRARDLCDRPSSRVAQGHRGVVEQGRELRGQLRASQLQRRRSRGFGDDHDLGLDHLDARGGLVALDHRSHHLDDRLGHQGRHCRARVRIDEHDLRDAAPVPQQHEADVRQLSLVVQPARHPYALADPRREIDRKGPFHARLHPVVPDVRARGSSRCHRTSPPGGGLVRCGRSEGVTPRQHDQGQRRRRRRPPSAAFGRTPPRQRGTWGDGAAHGC